MTYQRQPCDTSNPIELVELAYLDVTGVNLTVGVSAERRLLLHEHINQIGDQTRKRCARCAQVYEKAKSTYDSLPKTVTGQ